LFDADHYSEYTRYEVDADNDLVVDDAVGPNGQNWLGEGLDAFYADVQNRLTGRYVLVGVHHGRGFDSAHGLQMENWLDYGNGDFTPNPVYSKLSSMITGYLFNAQERSNGPPLITNLTKTPTKYYPGKSQNVPSNAPFRLALTTALIHGGFFGTHTALTPDPWWDEFAVDVRPGSANFGKAISKSNVSAIHDHRGWLGQPLGTFRRVYADADFAVSKSMIGNGSFDSSLSGWDSKNVSISRISSNTMDGSGAMYVSRLNSTAGGDFGAFVGGDQVNVTRNLPYTVAFSARASKMRNIKVSLGNDSFPIPVGPRWRRYVVTMNPTTTTATRLKFIVGGEDSELWFDSVYLFQGDANVFKREFENGLALSNATAQSRTIQLGSGFRRIGGTQDPTVNNGSRVSSVTLAPFDGIVLVRENGQTAPSPAPEPTPPSSGGGSIGDYVWRDADGDGIQDGSETGWSGATVRLRQCNGAVLSSTTTDGNGRYLFDNLGPGNYQLEFVKPSGGNYSPYQVSSGGRNSDADGATGLSWCASITSANESRLGIDAGFIPTAATASAPSSGTSSIGDYVWNDQNGNGLQDSSEPGAGGVTVQLRECNGILVSSTTTSGDGSFLFDNLSAGNYLLRFVAPSGASFTQRTAGSDGSKDSNADSSGNAHCVSVGANDTRRWIDAGLRF
jgi:hypothetical protein